MFHKRLKIAPHCLFVVRIARTRENPGQKRVPLDAPVADELDSFDDVLGAVAFLTALRLLSRNDLREGIREQRHTGENLE